MSRYPWRNTSEDISSQTPSQWETPGGAQKKADQAEQNAKTYTDQKMGEHVGKGGTAHANAVPNGDAGFMTGADKAKLDGVQAGANNYIHPATHPPSIIVQDTNNRFVTDTEKATWNAKANTDEATQSAKGLMPAADKVKLDGIQMGAEVNQNAFSTLNTIAAESKTDKVIFVGGTGITVTTDASKKEIKITATGNATPGPHAETHLPGGTDVIPFANSTTGGLMSDQDKRDLASTMTQIGQTSSSLNTHISDTTKHITATERNTWNAKETTEGAQSKANIAEGNAKSYADGKSSQAESNAKNYTNAIVGDLGQLQTVNKSNAVGAINEVFQSGVNAKNGVVGAINAKGVPASTSDDWNTLVYKIGLIQTEKGTTNLAPNFWSVCWGPGKAVQGRFIFQDGKILTGYRESAEGNFRYGFRTVDYNGTILSEQEFGRGDSNIYWFMLGPILNSNVLAFSEGSTHIRVFDHAGRLLYRIPYTLNLASISDIIYTRGSVFVYDCRNGKLFDQSGNVIVSVEVALEGFQNRAAYFVDSNTLAVDTGKGSGTIRWNGQWVVDRTGQEGGVMAMYLATLAAR